MFFDIFEKSLTTALCKIQRRFFYACTCSCTCCDFREPILSAYACRISIRTTLLSEIDIDAARALHSFLVSASI